MICMKLLLDHVRDKVMGICFAEGDPIRLCEVSEVLKVGEGR